MTLITMHTITGGGGGDHLPSTGLKATWWSGSGRHTYRRDWTTKVIFHVYQRFLEGYYH